MSRKGRLIVIVLVSCGLIALGIIFLQVELGNDWPRLYLSATAACNGKKQCTLDLAQIYGGRWESVVALDNVGEQGYKEMVVGKPLPEYEEFNQGLIFLSTKGEVIAEKYSAAHFELLLGNPRPKLRLSFPEEREYWKLSRPNTFVCASATNHGGHTFYSVAPGKCTEKGDAQ
ncbi:MAG TPA: hypothetical protein VIU93_04450 [Gallionellaceae bacterium]